MADAVVGFITQNLARLIRRPLPLNVLGEEISWIQTELRVMDAFLQSINAEHLRSEEVKRFFDQARMIMYRADDLFDTYLMRRAQESRSYIYLKLFGFVQLMDLGEELRKIRNQIVEFRRVWRSIRFAAKGQDLLASSSQHLGFAAIAKLDCVLQAEKLAPDLLECIKWVRDELAPLQDFLQEIDLVIVLGARQKIWIQELREIFQFVDERFVREVLELCEDDVQGSSFCRILDPDPIRSWEAVLEIQDKILQLYRRYCTYGLGKILDNDGSRSIFPRIRMTPIPGVSMSISLLKDSLPGRLRERRMTYLSWLMPAKSIESLRDDLKLMKALFLDISSMGYLEQRAKVWLNQMQKISGDLEALDELASNVSRGREGTFHEPCGPMKIDHNLMLMAYEIRDIAARKMTYGIGSALGEAGMLDAIAANFLDEAALEEPDTSKDELTLRRRVESIGKEHKLMEALFQDVERMEKLDPGLKVWVEEMLGVAREANAVQELDYKSSNTRDQAARRIKQVYHHISIMFKWKLAYDIRDVKSRRTGIFNHNLNGTEPYPSEAMKEEFEFLKREIKFMQTLYGDIKESDLLDVTAIAWVKEMHQLTRDVAEFTEKNTYITARRSDLHGIKDKIRQLSEIRIAYGIEPRKGLPPIIVGEIKEKLLADHEQPCIISIVGMGGIGKTALRRLINNDNAITSHFDWHTWIHVPEGSSAASVSKYTARKILEGQKAQFLDAELVSKSEARTEDELVQMLEEIKMHKKCLIVLDEIQTIEIWQYLEQVFPKMSTGSGIILITNEHTCSFLKSSSKAIFDPVKLGDLSSETMDMVAGSDALDSVPSYLMQCLFYFLVFPAKFEVPTRRLIVLWVAEGLVYQIENESVEDAACRYLHELIKLKMVLGKTKMLNGKFKACQLNEDIRDTLSMKAKGRFFQNFSGTILRLVDHNGGSDSCFIQIHGNPRASTSVQGYRNIRSFMSFDTGEGNRPGQDIGNFLHKCIIDGCFLELRILDLEKVFRPKLPEAICSLILLRYLGLRWTYVEHLPKYVNKLLNLKVLDVKHTYISVLPRAIWSMQYLRHLYLSEAHSTKFVGRPSDVSLDALQTLWGAFIDENTYVRNGLDTARNIRKLGLSCRSSSSELSLMSEQLKAINDWISNLELLEILRLKSRDENGEASELHLKPLRNRKLSTVYLLGKLEPSVVSEFPVNLTDITLSGSELSVDPMISLEKLPQLRILGLLAQSVVCRSMHCSKGGFPQLKVLKIWKLENLEEWEVEVGALPSLEFLEIRSCTNLKKLPDALQYVDTLQGCMPTSVPKHFIDQAKDRQPELWAKIKLD